ncbi:hypothetical protein B296_00017831 [Ensete ventricosum]|uniref:Uncharacterized protein n=1 Tax=Ensete ventricosum TaxID=4639 RepID=A0A426ZQY9_ENSVE|nr:hypothetical protein B296_00017831 [Ensete ventricosum]
MAEIEVATATSTVVRCHWLGDRRQEEMGYVILSQGAGDGDFHCGSDDNNGRGGREPQQMPDSRSKWCDLARRAGRTTGSRLWKLQHQLDFVGSEKV